MILNIFLFSLAIAGIGRLWIKIQKDFPGLTSWIKKTLPELLVKAITCSLCFTYWLTFLLVLFFNPLLGWSPSVRTEAPEYLINFLYFFLSWMSIGTMAWIIRFIIDDVQLSVHYQKHILKEKSGHK